jgi:hypothetical protein
MPYQVANFTKQDFGAPQIDLQGLRNAASQVAQDGFYNPFTKYFEQQQQQTMAPEFLNPYAPPSLYGNPYFMQPPPMFGGPMMPPTAPPMQADPYQDFISSLPGYQPRDQWMTKQAPVSKRPNDRPGMTYVPAEYRDGKLWSDAHYVNNDPPIPEYAPDGMTRRSGATPLIRSDGWSGYYDPATNKTVTEREARPDPRATAARPGQAQPIQPPSQGMPYMPSPPPATQKNSQPVARTQSPEDIAAIEEANKYRQSQLAAFKSQFAANVRGQRHATSGMSPELLQWAQNSIQDGDRDMGAYADVLYGPGAVQRLYATGKYR